MTLVAMRKVTKILLKALSVTLLFLIFCPIVLALIVDLPSVQNFIVDRAVKYVSRKLETTVSIDRIRVGALGSLSVEGFYVEDYARDTLLYVGKLRIYLNDIPGKSGIMLRNGSIADAVLNIREMPDGETNIKQVVSRLSNKKKKKEKGEFALRISDVQVDNLTLVIERREHRDPEYGIDFSDMHLNRTSAFIDDFTLDGGMVGGYIRNFATVEHSGFTVRNFTGRFLVDRGLIDLRDFDIEAEDSDVRLRSLTLRGDDWSAYKDFVHNVAIEGELHDTRVSTDDVAHFAPRLLPWKLALDDADIGVSGTVADLKVDVRNVSFGERSSLRAEAALRGLPDAKRATLRLDLKRLVTCEADIEAVAEGIAGKALSDKLLSMAGAAGDIVCAGSFAGGFDAFDTKLTLTTQAGNASFAATRKPLAGAGKAAALTASADVRHLRLGRLLQNKALGAASASVRFAGSVNDGALTGEVKGVVGSFEFKDCVYDSLKISGHINNRSFSGSAHSDGGPLRMALSGMADMNGEHPIYDFKLRLEQADLHAMNINRRDSVALLGFDADLYATGNGADDMNGSLTIDNGRYIYNVDTLRSGEMKITARSAEGKRSLNLASDFADAAFTGPTSYAELVRYLSASMRRYLPVISDAAPIDYEGDSDGYSALSVTVKNVDPLLDAVSDGLQLARGSKFNFVLNPAANRILLRAESDYLERNNVLATKLNLNVTNQGDSLAMYLSTEDFYAGTFHMPQLSVMGGAKNDRVTLSAGFSDTADSLSGVIGLSAEIMRDPESGMRRVAMNIFPTTITQGRKDWRITSDRITIDTARIEIRDFTVRSDGQMLHLDGIASRSRADSITLRLSKFNLAPFMGFAMRMGYTINGYGNGEASMKAALNRGEMTADIDLDSLSVNGISVVPLCIESHWDFEQQRARVMIDNLGTGVNIVRGYYAPVSRRYYAEAKLDNLPMTLLDPILSGVVSGTEGKASASLEIIGQDRNAELSGTIDVTGLGTTVDFTRARYTIPDARIKVEKNHLKTSNARVYDSERNSGLLTMDLNLEHLSNIAYEMRLVPRRMIVLNTTERDNDLFYGKVYASGVATVRGSKKGTTLDIVASTEGDSRFFMPLSGKSDASNADFVIFEKPGIQVDSTNYLLRKKMMFERRNRGVSESASTMNINIELTANPNAEVQLVIDPTVGDIIKVRGDGILNLNIVPRANVFDMYGDYTITEGSYLFTLQNIINKRFIIESGSTIQWVGEPMDARLNINAVYKLKASLQPLLSSTTLDNITRAVPVECIINLSDRLTNPTVTFDIKVPNADSEIRNAVANLLNNQQSIATQFMYLLVSGSFYSDSSTSSNIGATASATTGFELLSNQLSNWLSSDDYNIVLRYRPRSELTSDEIDFGFSKSLVNDRLLVELEGNYLVDNKMAANGNMSNFLGEAYITWLIDRSGNLKLRGFTQTIDRFDENQGLQETGIGIYYKEDFDNWSDLKRRVKERFMSKRRREQREREADSAADAELQRRDSTDRATSEVGKARRRNNRHARRAEAEAMKADSTSTSISTSTSEAAQTTEHR